MAFSCTQSVFIMYFRNLTMLKENKKTLTPPPSPLLLYNRKQLEEWQKSKGKVYKRPPMEIKAKRKVIEEMNISFWKSIEKEEEEKKAQLELSSKINKTLTECLQLIEEVRLIMFMQQKILNHLIPLKIFNSFHRNFNVSCLLSLRCISMYQFIRNFIFE